MKASEIFKEFDEEYKWLTRDSDDEIYLWRERPTCHLLSISGWWTSIFLWDCGLWVNEVDVDEFDNLDWKECIIEREKDSSEIWFDVGDDLILSTKTDDNGLTKLCEQFVKDFELDYVDDGKCVDNPPMMLMDYYVKFKQLL